MYSRDKASLMAKRKYEVMRTKVLIALTAAAVLIAATVCLTSVTVSGSTAERNKVYRSIMIEPGDTLWSIAETYCDTDINTLSSYIDEIREMNGISADHIRSGNYLVISYYTD